MFSNRTLITSLLMLLAIIVIGRSYLSKGNEQWAGDKNETAATTMTTTTKHSEQAETLDKGGGAPRPATSGPSSSPVKSSDKGAAAVSSSSSCTSATPGDPKLKFPCSSRIKGHNSLSFFSWDALEQQRKNRLLEPFHSTCAKMPSQRRGRSSVFGQAVGCEGTSGQWNRCWIVDMGRDEQTNTSVPTCVGGSSFDVMFESDNAKVAVDRIIDLDNGLYEVIFFIRKRGSYKFCVDAIGSHDKCVGQYNFRLIDPAKSKDSPIGRVLSEHPPVTGAPRQEMPRTPQFPNNLRCFPANFERGIDAIPLRESCRTSTDRDRFRFGAWFKMDGPSQKCDGIHCTGTPLSTMESWIWASDICIIHVYDRVGLHKLLNKTWIVGWGGSTMKQPMSNFVEYYMGHAIFKFYMAQLDMWKSKKKAGFFSYRQWGVTITNESLGTATTWNMLWGGCPGLVAAPSACTTTVGMRFWPRLEGLIGGSRGPNASIPTAILLDHFVWRWPMNDEVAFSEQSSLLFRRIGETAAKNKWLQQPLIVWHNGPSSANNDMSPRPDHCGQLAVTRHLCWTVEDDYDKNTTAGMLLISRDQITLPLHFGNSFVHFGVHYGASEGMCNTGHSRSERYAFANCVRRTWGDDAMIIMWLNAIDSFTQIRKR